jgi:hypothetical protein
VPDTMNFKRHPQVDPVRLESTDAVPWEPEVLEQAIPRVAVYEARERRLTTAYDGPRIDLLDYLESAEAEVLGDAPDEGGVKFAVVCPWAREHSGGDRTGTYVGQYADGALWFYCHHEHCQGRGWRDFRRMARPKGKVVIRLV